MPERPGRDASQLVAFALAAALQRQRGVQGLPAEFKTGVRKVTEGWKGYYLQGFYPQFCTTDIRKQVNKKTFGDGIRVNYILTCKNLKSLFGC